MTDCIFCKIADHRMPAKIIREDTQVVVIHDINPQAPVHLLVIPKKHITKISEMEEKDQALLGKMIFVAKQQAEQLGLHEKGYRLVFNNGREGGQAVFHIHLHLLGGRQMHWPPG
jgi:histidine triad (HIT) family protein